MSLPNTSGSTSDVALELSDGPRSLANLRVCRGSPPVKVAASHAQETLSCSLIPAQASNASCYLPPSYIIDYKSKLDMDVTKLPMTLLEARLGFNFARGISRDSRARRTPETYRLRQRLDGINTRYVSYGITRIRESEGIKNRVQDLFDELGPILWPDFDVVHGPFPSWLLDPSDVDHPHDNPLVQEYPRHLFYSDPTDRAILLERLQAFVSNKVLRYHDNHCRNLPTARDPVDLDCLPHSEESEVPEENDLHLDDDEAENCNSDTGSNYYTSKPRRVKIFNDTPKSIPSKKMTPYAVPTAHMIPRPPPMGNTQAKLDSASPALDRTTLPQKQKQKQKQHRTSNNDCVDRGSMSSPASVSSSVCESAPGSHPSPLTRTPSEISSGPQDQSIRVEACSASKRVRPADLEVEGSSRKTRNTQEVLCSRPTKPCLVVKLKLTRDKMPQGVHRQYTGPELTTPVLSTTSQLPIGQIQPFISPRQRKSCDHLLSAQGRRGLSLPPHPLKRHGTAVSSCRDSYGHPRQNENAADMTSTTNCVDIAEDANVDEQEEYLSNLPDLEDMISWRKVAAKTSVGLRVVEQAHVEHQAHVSRDDTPAATSTHDLRDGNGQSTVSEVNLITARADSPSVSTHLPKDDGSLSAEVIRSTEGVVMFVSIKREVHAEPRGVCTITLQGIMSGGGFFESLRDELGNNLEADETIVQADVKKISQTPIPGLITDFTMMKASKRNISWEMLLKGLRHICQKDQKCVEMELGACLLVKKVSDEKRRA